MKKNTPIPTLNSDRTVSVIEKVRSFFTLNDVTVIPDQWVGKVDYDFWAVSSKAFKEGRELFMTCFPHSLKAFIPPSASMTTVWFHIRSSMRLRISTTPTRTDIVCSSAYRCPASTLTSRDSCSRHSPAEATDTSLKAYYDISCKTKYTYDADSAEMLDLTFAGIQYDLTRIYNINGLNNFLYSLASKKDNTFSSDYAKIESKALADIEKLVEDMNGSISVHSSRRLAAPGRDAIFFFVIVILILDNYV